MTLATTAAAVAGSTAVAAYLEAKFHLKKDVKVLVNLNRTERARQRAARNHREATWYFFEERCRKQPDSECIWSRTGCYNSREAYEQCCRYAQYFLSKGVRPGEMVGVYMQNSPEFIFIWLGLWAIGCAPAMLNYNLAGDTLLHCLKIARVKLMMVDDEVKHRALEIQDQIENELGVTSVVLDDPLKRAIADLKPERPADTYRDAVQGTDPECLIYTSGTTGMPKGCVFPQSRGFVTGSMPKKSMLITEADRWYNCMPMYHGTGGVSCLIALLNGLTLCIGKKFSVSKFWNDIHDSRATWFTYVGETARYLLAAPPTPNDKDNTLRGMWGNGLRPDVWIKFRDRFGIYVVDEFFNSSEGVFGLSNAACGGYLATAVGHHGLPLRIFVHKTYVPVAIDTSSNDLYRDPKTGFAVRQPYAVGGEMLVKLPNEAAFTGYYGNAKSTAAKYERNVFQKGDLYYRSGDALRRDDEGRWFFLDRLGDTFRWKSENVSTAEVAEVLGRYPGVVEANVYGVLVPGHDGRAGCAAIYVEPAERKDFDFQGLARHAQKLLPHYAVPLFLRLVTSMTPSHNNKQNKVPLREEGADPQKLKEGGSGDVMFWVVKDGSGPGPAGKTDAATGLSVEPFGETEWKRLGSGGVRL